MPYFTIEKTGCSVADIRGYFFTEVRYNCYLNPNDIGYEKKYLQQPIIPEEGYTGEPEDYDTWVTSLPTGWVNNYFHIHFVQFTNVTDEEILFVGELALSMAYERWTTICNEDLDDHSDVVNVWSTLKNQPLILSVNNQDKNKHEDRITEILEKDFTKTTNANLYSIGDN